MAACTLAVGTADTGAPPNNSGNFIPVSGDLLVVLIEAAATIGAAPSLTSSIGGFTFSLIDQQTHSTTSHSEYVYVADALVSDTSSQTVTWDDDAGDPSTGTVIFVYRVSGMSKSGTAAVRQFVGNFGNAPTTPNATFSSSCLTGNPTIAILGNNANPAGITCNASWTEPVGGDLGHASPVHGAAVCHRDSGFTGTGVTWGAASSTTWGIIMLELDASASARKGGLSLMGMGR